MLELKFTGRIILFLPVFYAFVALIWHGPMAGVEIPTLVEFLRSASEQVLFLLQTWLGYFPDPQKVDAFVVTGGFFWVIAAFVVATVRLTTR